MSDTLKPIVVTLRPGQAIRIELADTDGAFEIHYDTPVYSNQLVVAEVENLPDSYGRRGVLYHEDWRKNTNQGVTLPVADEETESVEGDEGEIFTGFCIPLLTFAVYSVARKQWWSPHLNVWVDERDRNCEFEDPSAAHRLADKLLRDYGLSTLLSVVRSDQQV